MSSRNGLNGMSYKKLVVISHTPHQQLPDGTLIGWGPTVSEINYLSIYWEKIVHIACLEPCSSNPSLQPYQNDNIELAFIPSFGGRSLWAKLSVFYLAPQIIYKILNNLKGATHIQIRVPMGIGIYVLPLFLFIPRKFILWVKYANNWQHLSASLAYRFQRWFLKQNFLQCKVTMNGFWPNQESHCLSFENPSFANDQVELKKEKKNFSSKLKMIFIGRLESAKGIDLIIDMLEKWPLERIEEWIFVGDGELHEALRKVVKRHNINARFLGFISQLDASQALNEAHVLLLPSKSEGFPKVVSEAWVHGVIPIVSSVGSIPHYVKNEENGFLMNELSAYSLHNALVTCLNATEEKLNYISENGRQIAQQFTFERYVQRLKTEVFV
jgi:glycosyltransferase involved in cell wall biosynthesis